MARIDFLILGYRKLKISPEDLTAVTSLFLRYGIPSQIDSSGNIIVRERDYDKIRGLLQGRIEYTISKPLGLFGRWLGLENKAVYIFSIIASAIIVVLLSSIIWDVRVEGNSKITDSEIVCMLSECGLSIGDFWSSVNRSKVESALLKSQDNLSWVSINRRGVVAYIKVIERNEEKEGNQAKLEYSNIVASRDCIIEEITVSKGIALVKPGDVVKKGDIIILGSLPDEAGGRFCAAEGEVCGRIKEEVKLVVDRKYEKKSETVYMQFI